MSAGGTPLATIVDEGEALLTRGAVAHNHRWFYRDAMEAMPQRARWEDALRYAKALETYTSGEPLPWSELFVVRVRALASWAMGSRDAAARLRLQTLLSTLDAIGLVTYRGLLVAATE